MSDIRDDLRDEFLGDKDYAHAYMDSHVDAFIATQIKVLREQREWSQEKLAAETGMKQERISVLENVDYASWSLSTLRRFAKAYDLVVRVTFEEFGTEIGRMSEFSAEGLKRRSRVDDLGRIAGPERIQFAGSTPVQMGTFLISEPRRHAAATTVNEITRLINNDTALTNRRRVAHAQ